MKRVKRALALVLLLILSLRLFPAAADDVVYLGDREDLITARESLDGLGLNKAHSGEKITVWELSFKKGLGFHCLPDKDAYLEFDISSLGMKYFAATVGVLQKASYYIELGSIAFCVYGDGRLLAESPMIQWGKKPYYFSVNVEGVKTLRLVEKNVDGHSCDAGVWGDAALYMTEPEAPEWWTESGSGFDPDRTDLPQPEEVVSGDLAYVSDLYFKSSSTYSGNVVGRDCNTANEIIFSTDGKFFPKGVGFHASSGDYTAYADVNIEGLGFTKFAAYVGVCETLSPHDISMASVGFALFGDGEKLWESGAVKFGEAMKPMEADISGVKILRLAVRGMPSISGAWATWGGAVMSRSGNIKDTDIYSDKSLEDLFGDTDTTPAVTDKDDVTDTEPLTENTADTQPDETTGGGEGGKNSTLPVIVGAVAAAAVIAAITAVIVKKRK